MNRILKQIVIGASVAFVIKRFFEQTKVNGNSMFPELHDGDRLLLDKGAYRSKDPEAGDVVVFASNGEEEKFLIKRIIGVPGDHVEIHDGDVFVNGIKTNDEFTAGGDTEGSVDVTVPEGRYFVLGDNRMHSRDSRDAMVGMVPREAIMGKVNIRLYPPGRVFKREVLRDGHLDE